MLSPHRGSFFLFICLGSCFKLLVFAFSNALGRQLLFLLTPNHPLSTVHCDWTCSPVWASHLSTPPPFSPTSLVLYPQRRSLTGNSRGTGAAAETVPPSLRACHKAQPVLLHGGPLQMEVKQGPATALRCRELFLLRNFKQALFDDTGETDSNVPNNTSFRNTSGGFLFCFLGLLTSYS